MDAAFWSAMVLAGRNGLPFWSADSSGLRTAAQMSHACADHVKREGPSFQLEHARDTFAALVALQLTLDRRDASASDVAPLAMDLGQKLALTRMDVDGVWEAYWLAATARSGLSKGGQNRKTEWRAEFAPVARAFCKGQSLVTYGQLIRYAREVWAPARERAGKPVALPRSEKGILKGLKWLQAEGALHIPGK
jgi:hypothetical protein